MLRSITNRFAGRRKSKDEPMNMSEAIGLFSGLNGSTRGNIRYIAEFTDLTHNVDLGEMVSFIRNKFFTIGDTYTDIQHQVYSGESGDKHYIEMAKGNLHKRRDMVRGFGVTEVRGRPFRRATINFLVQKK